MVKISKTEKLAVLLGGRSPEREISLKSGEAILASLKRQGYEAYSLDVDQRVAENLIETRPDAVILALHGRYGEDGTIQGLLEMMDIPYSGSGVLASAICMDKTLTKDLVSKIGITVPQSCTISSVDELAPSMAAARLQLPVVVKPNREGSTLGMRRVQLEEELVPAVEEALRYDQQVLIETYIKGSEVTVGLLNGKSLPVLEVVPQKGFYDYESKYTKGMTDYIVPARLPEATATSLQEQSERLYHHLNLRGVVRADFLVDESETPYFLEVNTIPGMTETSLIPKAAAHVGIDFDGVVQAILESIALKR